MSGGKDSTLAKAIDAIEREGAGVIVIIRELSPDALSRRLQKTENPGKPNPLLKDYGIGAQILTDLGITTMTLLTDSPKNIVGLEGYGLSVAGHRPLKGQS